jgi:hypothetical protein
MRKSAFLLFLILFAGIGFSQQGGSKNSLNLNEILKLVDSPNINTASRVLLKLGYESTAEGEFTNGSHKFRLVSGKFGLVYSEDYQSKSRSEDLKRQAVKVGFEIKKDAKTEMIMKSEFYEMVIGLRKIEIKKLKA